MSEMTEFEEARRRRRRKKALRRTGRLAVVLAIAGVLALTGFAGWKLGWGTYFSNLFASLPGGSGFPVSLDQQEATQLLGMKGSVAVCTDGAVTVYNTRGVKTGNFPHSYNTPISVYSGGRLLTYDLGGTGWMLTDKTKKLYSSSTEHIILGAALNDQGTVAVSCRGGNYLSEITVYNTHFEEIFLLNSADCYVTQLAVSDSGTLLAVGGVTAEGGALGSTLRLHDMTGKGEPAGLTLKDSVILSMRFTAKNDLVVVTTGGAYRLGTNGTLRAEAEFAEAPVAVAISEEGLVAAATGDYRSREGVTVTAYDAVLQPAGSTALEHRVLSLQYEKKHLFILAEGELLLADPALSEANSRGGEGIQMLAPWGNAYYAVTNSGLIREKL